MVLIAVGMFVFMSTLDASIVNIALPSIAHDLHIGSNQSTWTVTIYLIVVSGLMILFGRLGDQVGQIRVFKVGTVIFTVGSLIAGFNFGLLFLLFARVVQAFGAAMTMSNSFGILTSTFPPTQRARVMAMNGIFVSIGLVSGPGLGGLILQFLPWNCIFWINVPIGIFAIIIGYFFFPNLPRPEKIFTIDWAGAILFFATISILFFGVEYGQNSGFVNLIFFGCTILAVILFISFLLREQKIKHPLIDLTIFKNRIFSISVLAAFLTFVISFFMTITMPFYLQDLLGWSPGASGLVMMIFPVVLIIVGPISGYIADHHNKEVITAIGIGIVALTQIGFILFGRWTPVWFILLVMFINSIGNALFQSPNNALLMSSVPKTRLGVAGSLSALARNLGMICGISISTVLTFSQMKVQSADAADMISNQPDLFVNGMHLTYWGAFIVAVASFMLVSYRLFTGYLRNKKNQ